MSHLWIALIFSGLGLAMIVFPEQFPDFLQRRIVNTQLSAGWILVLFGAWHTLRWWMWRAAQRRRLLEREPPPQRGRANPEYHPEFDFNEPDDGPDQKH
jgi:hypothetical protein